MPKIEYPTITKAESERLAESDARRQARIRKARLSGNLLTWALQPRYERDDELCERKRRQFYEIDDIGQHTITEEP